MSGEFKQFSEGARLYAQYVEVVEKMEQFFMDDITSFLDAVATRMQMKCETGRLGEEITKEYRSWWLEADETKDNGSAPYVWLERKNQEIVTPGVLTVIADVDDATEAEKRQLAACRSSLSLPGHCKFLDRRLFGVSFAYGDKDPVEAVAEPILSILGALHEVEKKIYADRLKNGRVEKTKGKKPQTPSS